MKMNTLNLYLSATTLDITIYVNLKLLAHQNSLNFLSGIFSEMIMRFPLISSGYSKSLITKSSSVS